MHDPHYVVARSVLLDALEALGEQREAVVVVGAQAIYLHTGAIELAVPEFTIDADLTIDPALLHESPEIESAMRAVTSTYAKRPIEASEQVVSQLVDGRFGAWTSCRSPSCEFGLAREPRMRRIGSQTNPHGD